MPAVNHDDATMIVSPEALGRSMRTGELRTQHLNPPDPKRPIAVVRPERVWFYGLGPGETPVIQAQGTVLRWARDRRYKHEVRRARMERKRRRGWA